MNEPEKALTRSERALAALQEEITRHCHELRQPLLGIKGYAELMAGTPDDATLIADGTKQVLQQAERLERMADELTAKAAALGNPVAAQSSESTSPRGITTDLHRPIEAALKLFHYRMRGRIAIEARLDEDLPRVSMGPDAMERIAINLISNALDALPGPGPGTLAIRAQADPARGIVNIDFADDGLGIPDDLRSRVFEPYRTTKAKGRGTGLGLAICRDLAMAAGGELALCTAETPPAWPVPVKTVFRLSLPIAQR